VTGGYPKAGSPAKATAGMEHLAAAWEWALRLRDETVTEIDLAEWLAWYEANEAHRQAFESVQTLWHGVPRVLEGPGALTLKELLREPSADSHYPSAARANAWMPWSSRRILGVATAMALALVATVCMLFVPRLPRAISSLHSPSAARGVPLARHDVLPDGSRVELAPKSTLALRFTKSVRLVDLKGGEAYFAVVHNRLRPFVVRVGDLRVVDVGTAFNIRKSGDRIVVAVFEGTVNVSSSYGGQSAEVTLNAGQQATWNSGSPHLVLARANLEQTLAWRQGRLEYLNEPLSGVIADINRYTKTKVIIGDPAVGRLVFSGTVFIDATNVWIQALPSVFPVTLSSGAKGDWVLAESASR